MLLGSKPRGNGGQLARYKRRTDDPLPTGDIAAPSKNTRTWVASIASCQLEVLESYYFNGGVEGPRRASILGIGTYLKLPVAFSACVAPRSIH
jgi:hypothetical protein